MPLHDWADDRGFVGFRHAWQSALLGHIQSKLPDGYRAHIAARLAVAPDVTRDPAEPSVRNGTNEWDEAVASFRFEEHTALQIGFRGQLIAVLEIASAHNKRQPSARETFAHRYAGYLYQSVHLLLIDVLPRPVGFSFADGIAGALHIDQPPCPVPYAVSYRVGEPVPEGTLVARWVRPLKVGEALPTIPLALNVYQSVLIDLEHTYREAARRLYLE